MMTSRPRDATPEHIRTARPLAVSGTPSPRLGEFRCNLPAHKPLQRVRPRGVGHRPIDTAIRCNLFAHSMLRSSAAPKSRVRPDTFRTPETARLCAHRRRRSTIKELLRPLWGCQERTKGTKIRCCFKPDGQKAGAGSRRTVGVSGSQPLNPDDRLALTPLADHVLWWDTAELAALNTKDACNIETES